jgi:uncharacterized membrane protein (UPF0127 family)
MKVILIADNDMTRATGLMHHRPLEKDECAYFYFKREGSHSFWNKNVDFPISLIFCNGEGRVRDIKTLDAQQIQGVYPQVNDIQHVFETHINAPIEYGIKIGSKIMIQDNEVHFK